MKKGDGKPRSDSRRATEVIAFRVTPEIHALLIEEAANDGYASPALWVKDITLERLGRPGRDARPLADLVRAINRIGICLSST